MLKFLFLSFLCSLIFHFAENETSFGQTQSRQKKTVKSRKQKGELTAEQKRLLNEIDKQKEANRPTKVYVFVGEKIQVESFEPKLESSEILMNAAFKAKYKVIQNVFGNYNKDVIEFEVYDHYGKPPFSKYQNVLLFVSEYGGKLYHEKYQYFDVYKTKDGKWASCGDPYRFDNYHRKNIKTVNLEFDKPLIFNLNDYNKEFGRVFFKQPYFRVVGNQAECVQGLYVDGLFTVKKEGVLKARKIFK